MTSIAPASVASPASFSLAPGPAATTASGVARMPPGSLRATPRRTVPTSTASRTPSLTGTSSASPAAADLVAAGCARAGRDPRGHPGRSDMPITLPTRVPQSGTNGGKRLIEDAWAGDRRAAALGDVGLPAAVAAERLRGDPHQVTG
jgi:hypothetical protein